MLHEFNKRARFRCPWHCRFAAENLFSMNRMSCLFSQAPDRSDTLMIWVSKMNTSNIIQYKTRGFQKEYFNVFHIILGMGLIWIYHSKQMQTSNQKYLPSISFHHLLHWWIWTLRALVWCIPPGLQRASCAVVGQPQSTKSHSQLRWVFLEKFRPQSLRIGIDFPVMSGVVHAFADLYACTAQENRTLNVACEA